VVVSTSNCVVLASVSKAYCIVMQVLTKYLTLFIIQGYLLFVALGSAPIWIGHIKLDNLIGLGLAISVFMLLLTSGRLAGIGQWIFIAGLFYFITLFISVIFFARPYVFSQANAHYWRVYFC
jgi:hypothetical protein